MTNTSYSEEYTLSDETNWYTFNNNNSLSMAIYEKKYSRRFALISGCLSGIILNIFSFCIFCSSEPLYFLVGCFPSSIIILSIPTLILVHLYYSSIFIIIAPILFFFIVSSIILFVYICIANENDSDSKSYLVHPTTI